MLCIGVPVHSHTHIDYSRILGLEFFGTHTCIVWCWWWRGYWENNRSPQGNSCDLSNSQFNVAVFLFPFSRWLRLASTRRIHSIVLPITIHYSVVLILGNQIWREYTVQNQSLPSVSNARAQIGVENIWYKFNSHDTIQRRIFRCSIGLISEVRPH